MNMKLYMYYPQNQQFREYLLEFKGLKLKEDGNVTFETREVVGDAGLSTKEKVRACDAVIVAYGTDAKAQYFNELTAKEMAVEARKQKKKLVVFESSRPAWAELAEIQTNSLDKSIAALIAE